MWCCINFLTFTHHLIIMQMSPQKAEWCTYRMRSETLSGLRWLKWISVVGHQRSVSMINSTLCAQVHSDAPDLINHTDKVSMIHELGHTSLHTRQKGQISLRIALLVYTFADMAILAIILIILDNWNDEYAIEFFFSLMTHFICE